VLDLTVSIASLAVWHATRRVAALDIGETLRASDE
jgi:hypothetical protein